MKIEKLKPIATKEHANTSQDLLIGRLLYETKRGTHITPVKEGGMKDE